MFIYLKLPLLSIDSKFYIPPDKTINPKVLTLIDGMAEGYLEHAEEMNIWPTVIYAGMIAEENKEHAILKKGLKD